MIEVEVGKNQSLDNLDEKLGEIGLRLKNMKDRSDKTSASMSAGFKASADAASMIPGPIGMAATAMNGLTGGIGKAVIAMETLKGAIISTGIGALLDAVGSLIAYFTGTDSGADTTANVIKGKTYTSADTIEALFTPTSFKLDEETAGEIVIFARIVSTDILL